MSRQCLWPSDLLLVRWDKAQLLLIITWFLIYKVGLLGWDFLVFFILLYLLWLEHTIDESCMLHQGAGTRLYSCSHVWYLLSNFGRRNETWISTSVRLLEILRQPVMVQVYQTCFRLIKLTSWMWDTMAAWVTISSSLIFSIISSLRSHWWAHKNTHHHHSRHHDWNCIINYVCCGGAVWHHHFHARWDAPSFLLSFHNNSFSLPSPVLEPAESVQSGREKKTGKWK